MKDDIIYSRAVAPEELNGRLKSIGKVQVYCARPFVYLIEFVPCDEWLDVFGTPEGFRRPIIVGLHSSRFEAIEFTVNFDPSQFFMITHTLTGQLHPQLFYANDYCTLNDQIERTNK